MTTTSTKTIPHRELLEYRADVKTKLFRQIRKRFNQLVAGQNFKQKDLATRLGMDEGLLSKRMRGENDMRLETLSDLARGLDCRIEVKLVPLEEVAVMDLRSMPIRAISESVSTTARPGGGVPTGGFAGRVTTVNIQTAAEIVDAD